MRLGKRPRLFRQGIIWDCFVANRGIVRCSHQPYEAQTGEFVNALDPRLSSCWKDLHAFSCMSNLAYQTTQKLSPHTYNEMMISILYRLLSLSFAENTPQEAIRIGLLTFSSTIFLTRLYMKQPYPLLFNLFGTALSNLCQPAKFNMPRPIMLWLMILYHVVAYKQPSFDEWQSIWLRKAILFNGISVWLEARRILKSIMWVDFVHDVPGKKAFEEATRVRDKPQDIELLPPSL